MIGPRFEWFVAWRHLRDREKRSWWPLGVGLALIALGGACYAGAAALGSFRAGGGTSLLATNLRLGGSVLLEGGLIVSILGTYCSVFTLFSGISMFGVFLGTAGPIIALSVMSGFETDLKSKIRGAKSEVVITLREDKPFTDADAVRRKIAAVPGVVASTPYVEAEVMLKSDLNVAGVVLKGIDPESAPRVLELGNILREGRIDHLAHPEQIPNDPLGDLWGPPRKRGGEGAGDEGGKAKEDAGVPKEEKRVLPGILIGEELYSKTLKVFVGSEVDVACPMCGVGPTGPTPKLRSFRVAGHFYSGMYEFDQKLAYVSVAEAQRFLGMPGEVTGIEVRTDRPDHARHVAAAIQTALGRDYEVRSWEELNKALFMALKLEKIAMFVVLTFIALVAAFSILSTLIMLVTEKGQEVAILKSMGASDGGILRIFVAEGVYIGLGGIALGLAYGIARCILIKHRGLALDPDVYYIQKLPVVMREWEIGGIAAAAMALCVLATLYPAWQAAALRPASGLRYQ